MVTVEVNLKQCDGWEEGSWSVETHLPSVCQQNLKSLKIPGHLKMFKI